VDDDTVHTVLLVCGWMEEWRGLSHRYIPIHPFPFCPNPCHTHIHTHIYLYFLPLVRHLQKKIHITSHTQIDNRPKESIMLPLPYPRSRSRSRSRSRLLALVLLLLLLLVTVITTSSSGNSTTFPCFQPFSKSCSKIGGEEWIFVIVLILNRSAPAATNYYYSSSSS